jgi:hypothetical protein
MPNLNNEGIDDNQTDGHALRSGTVSCGAFLP